MCRRLLPLRCEWLSRCHQHYGWCIVLSQIGRLLRQAARPVGKGTPPHQNSPFSARLPAVSPASQKGTLPNSRALARSCLVLLLLTFFFLAHSAGASWYQHTKHFASLSSVVQTCFLPHGSVFLFSAVCAWAGDAGIITGIFFCLD